MKTKKINVYDYEELSETAKQKVLNSFRETNQYDFLDENLNEYLQELLKENKIKFACDLKLYYSLSYCQGDGVCFTGFFNWGKYNIKIIHNFNYCHKKSTNIYINYYDKKENEQEATEKVYNNFKNIYYSICDKLEKAGYEYIESEDSEENIKENIVANGYTFRINGEMENI